MKPLPLIAAALTLAAASSFAYAQSASSVGAGSSSGSSGTVGTAGSGAAGGTSASTLGLGGTSSGTSGTSSTIGGGGSAATPDGGKATTSNKINDNPNKLQDQAKARAQDGGTWSKSQTKTTVEKDGDLQSRTKSMAQEPGGPPAKSTTTQSVPVTR